MGEGRKAGKKKKKLFPRSFSEQKSRQRKKTGTQGKKEDEDIIEGKGIGRSEICLHSKKQMKGQAGASGQAAQARKENLTKSTSQKTKKTGQTH